MPQDTIVVPRGARGAGFPPEVIALRDAAAVRAAGGIVVRPGPFGLLELVLVHRPGYDDWTLPKGKLYPGEAPEAGALREVQEETGLVCELGDPVGCTRYTDRKGRDKVACYWLMRPIEGSFSPHFEVDEMRWLTVEEALQLLSYDRDRALLSALEEGQQPA